jgi:flagella basal body P-ring formation protein FlgA
MAAIFARLMKLKYPTILCSCWFTLACAARAQEPAAWQLLPEAKVDSAGIFLNQLVAPSSSSVVNPAPVVLPQIRLAAAPPAGQTVYFSRTQIAELAQKTDSGLGMSNWSGAMRVRVSRRTRLLTDSEMTAMLTAALQQDYAKDRGELELHLSHPLSATNVPDEPLALKAVDLPATGLSPSFIVRCELWSGQEHVGDWQLPVTAKLWHEIPLARYRLNRGELFKETDVVMERRDILIQRDTLQDLASADGPLELTESIPAGTPVWNRSVRVRPVIRRGRLVDGVYQDGSLSISLKVETLEDGQPGQSVRVRNPKTKRELIGKVQNEQTVLIAL